MTEREISRDGLSRRVLSNTGWAISRQLTVAVLGFATTLIVSRYLGPNEYGKLVLATALVSLVLPIRMLAHGEATLTGLVEQKDEHGKTFWSATWMAVAIHLSILLLLPLVAWLWFDDVTVVKIVAVLSVAQLGFSFQSARLWFEARLNTRIVVIASLVAVGSAVGLKLVLVAVSSGTVAFAFGVGLEWIVEGLVLFTLFLRQSDRLKEKAASLARIKSLLWANAPLVLAGLTAVVHLRIDRLMLEELTSTRVVGLYSASAQVVEATTLLAALVGRVYLPVLVLHKDDPQEYERALQRFVAVLVWVAIALAVTLGCGSRVFFRLAYGSQFFEAWWWMAILVASIPFTFLAIATGRHLLAVGNTRASAARPMVGALVNVLLNWFFIPIWGGAGAAAATVLAYVLSGFIMNFFLADARIINTMVFASLNPKNLRELLRPQP